MSYQVLARKWRPRSFASLVGQEHVVRALTHALTEQRLHHAYLFTGTRGVGKTTLARILAKSLNCEAGVSATPCNVCSACVEIDAGRFVDLLEVDAATNTRVDEMRQLLENAVYAPTRGRFKVYVIDEVHMLSNSAFNAMLKTLEEPPAHVKFILATTDPQKIPVTVLSRCLQFNLKQMAPHAIAGHLAHVLDAEGVAYEASALSLIARSAAGSMRDALSLLDQAIAHGAGKVEAAQVREMLGSVDLDYLFDLLDALAEGDASAMVAVAARMQLRSLSFGEALGELANLLTRIQVQQFVPGAADETDPDAPRIAALVQALSPEFVQLAYQIVVQGRQELPLAPDEYAGFVMTLLRLHAFAPAETDSVPVVRAAPPVRTAPVSPPKAVSAALASPVAPVPAAVPAVLPAPTLNPAEVRDWRSLIDTLGLGGMARTLAQHCELRQMDERVCLLRLSPSQRHLLMKPAQDKLQQVLAERFAGMALRIEVAEVEVDTPAQQTQRQRQVAQDEAESAIRQDDFVLGVGDVLGASVIDASIKPLF